MNIVIVLFYWLFLGIVLILAFVFIIPLGMKSKYNKSLYSKFFLYKNPPFKPKKFWLHACSFGEVQSLKTLIDKLDDLNLSVTTNTGFSLAKKYCKDVRYLPYDFWIPFWARKHEILIVTEAELWLLLFFIMKQKKTKTILINARISDKSYKNYYKFRFFYKILFSYIDIIFAQSKTDQKRLTSLGAKKIIVNGNIKAGAKINYDKNYKKFASKIITLASTHESEEMLILNEIKDENATILIAPRHPERFASLDTKLSIWCKDNNKTYSKFSSNSLNANVILVDKMGELINLYSISNIVILGGSFIKNIGGHNPIEPSFFNTILLSGKYIHNQKELFKSVENVYFCQACEIKALLKQNLLQSYINFKNPLLPILNHLGIS